MYKASVREACDYTMPYMKPVPVLLVPLDIGPKM